MTAMLRGARFWRQRICARIYVAAILLALFFAPHAFGNDSAGRANVLSPGADRINLYRTLNFDAYKATGTEKERKEAEERMASAKPAGFFLEGIKKIDKRITVLVIGMMFCPDCKAVYPYVEAMKSANPFISTRYLTRNDTPGAREFIISHTGLPNVPTILVVRPDNINGYWNGRISGKAYVETPGRVTDLLQAAKSERERAAVWKDFHEGVYDEEIQRDLLDLILEDNEQ